MRFFIIFLATIGFMVQSSFAAFPDKTIRLIVPWKAGGGTDTIARGFVGAFADAAGVDVVISNVVGGAGSKGVIQVQQAKNDGYTLLLNGTDTIIGLNTFKKMPFTADSFEYVGGMFERGWKDIRMYFCEGFWRLFGSAFRRLLGIV